MNKKIAIISFFHYETSLCLAKYLAKQGVCVDYYAVVDFLRDKGCVSGLEYYRVKNRVGIHLMTKESVPEIYEYTKGLNVRFYLLRIFSFSPKANIINFFILRLCMRIVLGKRYDAINVIGQNPLVEFIHNFLKSENIIHTFHEVGSHQEGITITPLLKKIIEDESNVILQSKSSYARFLDIPDAKKCRIAIIPFGRMETLLLYDDKNVDLNLTIDVRKPTFLFYGLLRPYKGLDLLVKVMDLLKNDYCKFNLVIAGAGYDENLRFFKAFPNCSVINRFLTNGEMMKLNRMAFAVLLPYKSASQSGIVVNTFLYGKPIIGTRVGALSEVIKDGENGLLVRKDDPVAFAAAMKKLLQDASLYEKLCVGVRSFGVGDDFDWNKISKQTLDFFMSNTLPKNNV